MKLEIRMFVATLSLFLAASARAADKPNIVIFLSDDMGWNELGYQGNKAVPTPNIDRLAREGTRLNQFYVCSVCSPSRASLMTGRYPFRTGMEERSHGNDVAGMLTDERTLAQGLKEAGYSTAIMGKWHLGEWYKKHLPMQRGFDHQYGHYSALIDSFFHCRDTVYDWHRDEQLINEDGYSTFLIADEFSRVLKQQDAGKPFFYYVAFNAVHSPHQAPREYVTKYHNDKEKGQLDCMDVAVGRMLKDLSDKGILDNTLVIFFNDNGSPQEAANKPLRGKKGQTYEGGVRTPCVMRWPGHVPAGGETNAMIHVVDLFPTLVDIGGGSTKQPLPLDGMDVWESIVSGKPSPRTEMVLSAPPGDVRAANHIETGPPALRQGDWKLVDKELFNISQDPYETKNLATENPDKVKAMTERLAAIAKERRPPEPHTRIVDGGAVVFGEEESKHLPDWFAEVSKKIRAIPVKERAQTFDPDEEEPRNGTD